MATRLQRVLTVACAVLALCLAYQMVIAPRRVDRVVFRSVGDTLPPVLARDIVLNSRAITGAKRLAGVTPGCKALVFFSGTCPACKKVATEYQGRSEVLVGGKAYGLIWVGTSVDDSADYFLRLNRLPNHATVQRADFMKLGVDRVPLLYLVTERGELIIGSHPASKNLAEIDSTMVGQSKCVAV